MPCQSKKKRSQTLRRMPPDRSDVPYKETRCVRNLPVFPAVWSWWVWWWPGQWGHYRDFYVDFFNVYLTFRDCFDFLGAGDMIAVNDGTTTSANGASTADSQLTQIMALLTLNGQSDPVLAAFGTDGEGDAAVAYGIYSNSMPGYTSADITITVCIPYLKCRTCRDRAAENNKSSKKPCCSR